MRFIVTSGVCLLSLALLVIGTVLADGQSRHVGSSADNLVLVGRVVRVTDGDTIRVEMPSGQLVIRLDGIDAPESQQKGGAASGKALAELVGDKMVELAPVLQDRYDRLVAVVYLEGEDINAEMIRTGHAWAYRRYMRDASYCELEEAARDARRGLWQENPRNWIAPWEFRQRRRLSVFSDYSGETLEACIAAIGK